MNGVIKRTENNIFFNIASREILKETFTAKYNCVLPRTPSVRPKSEIYTPKRDAEHPRPFQFGDPPPPLPHPATRAIPRSRHPSPRKERKIRQRTRETAEIGPIFCLTCARQSFLSLTKFLYSFYSLWVRLIYSVVFHM